MAKIFVWNANSYMRIPLIFKGFLGIQERSVSQGSEVLT